jgi:hypothetical protein
MKMMMIKLMIMMINCKTQEETNHKDLKERKKRKRKKRKMLE